MAAVSGVGSAVTAWRSAGTLGELEGRHLLSTKVSVDSLITKDVGTVRGSTTGDAPFGGGAGAGSFSGQTKAVTPFHTEQDFDLAVHDIEPLGAGVDHDAALEARVAATDAADNSGVYALVHSGDGTQGIGRVAFGDRWPMLGAGGVDARSATKIADLQDGRTVKAWNDGYTLHEAPAIGRLDLSRPVDAPAGGEYTNLAGGGARVYRDPGLDRDVPNVGVAWRPTNAAVDAIAGPEGIIRFS
ncbi:MAG: hypothetical protein JWM98_2454 [Thermoleophilia bacterium]|nr:hypothetical protein [Thermoleophilia bacterium]